jgi:hypothetical protein
MSTNPAYCHAWFIVLMAMDRANYGEFHRPAAEKLLDEYFERLEDELKRVFPETAQ